MGFDTILVEACVTSITEATQAEAAGAHRLELCIDLAVGGVTAPTPLLEDILGAVHIPVQVLIRSRSGDFCYTEEEIEAMCRSTREAALAGASGMVFGALTAEGTVDAHAAARIREAANPLGVTMHRAFDATRDALEALEACTAAGFERILTSGLAPDAEQGLATLETLVKRAGPSISVMPGGTVRSTNVLEILRSTGAREIHARASAIEGIVAAIQVG